MVELKVVLMVDSKALPLGEQKDRQKAACWAEVKVRHWVLQKEGCWAADLAGGLAVRMAVYSGQHLAAMTAVYWAV